MQVMEARQNLGNVLMKHVFIEYLLGVMLFQAIDRFNGTLLKPAPAPYLNRTIKMK